MENVTTSVHETNTKRVVKSIPVPGTDNFVAVQVDTTVRGLTGPCAGKVLSNSQKEFICHREALAMYEEDPQAIPNNTVKLMTDSVMRVYREYGFHRADDEKIQARCGVIEDDLAALSLPFTALLDGVEASPVRFDFGAHMLFHPESDEIYPVAIYLDYIEFGLDNESYDLKKALAILKARSDVRIEADHEEEIQSIPYYNASEGRSRFIAAVYSPTPEMANRLWSVCQQFPGQYPSTKFRQAMNLIDALGLIEGGAMKKPALERVKSQQAELGVER